MTPGFLSKCLEKLPPLLFVASLCFFSFGYGVIAFAYQLFPYEFLKRGFDEFQSLTTDDFDNSFLHPARYSESGTFVLRPEQIMPGATLISTYWPETDWSYGLRLINANGDTLNHWEVRPEEIWPESPHQDLARGVKNVPTNYVHGVYLFPNGDLVFNIELLGLVRMNSCGEVLWKLPYRTHHSLFRADDGNFWVSGLRWIEEGNERAASFAGLRVPFVESTILEVAPDGMVLKEISLLESLYQSRYIHLLWNYESTTDDIMHLNDVEVLSEDIAGQYPLFEAGDLVVSMRDLNSIAVLDQEGAIKWLDAVNFNQQHDPDFEGNGWIAVFDNRTGIPNPNSEIGSSLLRSINPANGEVRDLYGADVDEQFYTQWMGKHQKLENGNRLVTEATAGRVFEVSPDGDTVWEWVGAQFGDGLVPEVSEGSRYDLDGQTVATWTCSGAP